VRRRVGVRVHPRTERKAVLRGSRWALFGCQHTGAPGTNTQKPPPFPKDAPSRREAAESDLDDLEKKKIALFKRLENP
jgi:hypothetical protein